MSVTPVVEYKIGDSNPTVPIWWFVNGALVNFSSGWTFAGKLYRADDRTKTVLFTKSTGFTGAAGSGTQSSGTANLTIAFATSGDFNTNGLTEGRHVFQIAASHTSDSTILTKEILFDLTSRV